MDRLRFVRLTLSFALTQLAGGHAFATEWIPPVQAHPEISVAGRIQPGMESLRDLTGIRILHTTYDNFAGAPTTFIGDLESRGAVVDVLDHTMNPYPLLDASYDILFLQAIGKVPTGPDLTHLLAWVRSGGKSILFEGVTFWLIDTANLLADSLDAGWRCTSIHPGAETITDIVAHPITANVQSLTEITDYYTRFVDIQKPATALFRRSQGEIVGACTELEGTRMAYIGMSVLWNNRLNLTDNRLLGNQAIDWLSEVAATVAIQPNTWSAMKNRYRR